jgi:hypothetical protein
MRSELRKSVFFRQSCSGTLQSPNVAEGDEHLVIGAGLAVVPHDPEVGAEHGSAAAGAMTASGTTSVTVAADAIVIEASRQNAEPLSG